MINQYFGTPARTSSSSSNAILRSASTSTLFAQHPQQAGQSCSHSQVRFNCSRTRTTLGHTWQTRLELASILVDDLQLGQGWSLRRSERPYSRERADHVQWISLHTDGFRQMWTINCELRGTCEFQLLSF